MIKKILLYGGIILIGGIIGASTYVYNTMDVSQKVAFGAPTTQNFTNIQPFIDNTYDNGSATNIWKNTWTNILHVPSLADGCTYILTGVLTSNPANPTCTSGGGGSGTGTVSTSTPLVSGEVDFSTSASTIGNDATFLFSTALKRLTVQNASTTVLTVSGASYFDGGFIASASSTIASALRLSSLSQGVLGVGSGGLLNTSATTTVSCSGSTSCTSFVAFGSSPITISSSGSGTGNVSTSTNEIAGRLAYWTSNSGTPALLGQVATTTLSVTSPLTVTGAFGALVGGSNSTINCQTASGSQAGCLSSTDWNTFNNKQGTISVTYPITLSGTTVGFNGLATTSSWTTGQVAYVVNGNTVASVATSSLAIGASLSNSGTLGSQIGGTASSLSLNLSNPNTWLALQTFTNSSTSLASFTYASSTFGYFGSLTIATTSAGCAAFMSSGLLTSTGVACGSGGGGGTINSGTMNRLSYYSGATTLDSANFLTVNTGPGKLGIGTTTPYAQLQIATSSGSGFVPQLMLTDMLGGLNAKHWYINSESGIFDIGTTSDTSFATSSALTISGACSIGSCWSFGSTTPYANFAIQTGRGSGDAFVISTSSGAAIGGYDNDGHRFASGPAGVISSCGTGSGSVVGNDQAGVITTATAATACTYTFSKAYQAAPVCTVTDNSLVGFADISSVSTSAITFGISSALTGGNLYYQCIYTK